MTNYWREASQSRKDLPGVTANSLPGLLGPLFWAWGEVEYHCCVVEGAAHLMGARKSRDREGKGRTACIV